MKEQEFNWRRALAIATGAGMTLLCTILFGLYLGYLLDKHVGTAPFGLLAGGVMGALAGLLTLVRDMIRK
ncbi:MAG: AtpZ/AtpI family protein [Negativicoccus succinicivorans]|uniref:AtpZ/AtpI family protein n=1 Tax=Negativicoccus succinicivorans TaxID=620903 RepID=UPI00290A4516|nr:AtpZ/AtpI family protein [Negativicoccus succinicivorans]MDU5915736.1 AtpZ/AtpI family protein [Negativicoccus succinicivorans]